MKLHTALLTATLLGRSRGQCPAELTGVETITPTLTMYYDLVLSDSEPGILCARFESQSEAWLGWGINPSGEMVVGEAVIGLPDEGSVRKFILLNETSDGVMELEEASQTLMETSIAQENGMTIMSFAKYLNEDQYGIFASGRPNSFIWAVGSGNTLGYHVERGNFLLEFTDGAATTAPTSAATDDSTGAPVAGGVITFPPTSDGEAITFAPTTGTDIDESDSVTSSPMMAEAGENTPSPTPAGSEIDGASTRPTPAGSEIDGASTRPTPAGSEIDGASTGPTPARIEIDGASTGPTPARIEIDGASTGPTPARIDIDGASSSPTPARSEDDVTTRGPSAVTSDSVSAEPTATSTESSTSNSTAASSGSSTSNSTSESTEPGRTSGAEASASSETGNSAMSSHNIGSLVVGVAALAIAFVF